MRRYQRTSAVPANPPSSVVSARRLELFRRHATLFHDRVDGTPPVIVRVVHHDVDEHGHEKGEDRGAVAHLVPVDLAVPGRAAVGDLVAKHVEPLEDEPKDADGTGPDRK